MRTSVLPAVLALVLVAPLSSEAQVYRHDTEPPSVTAAGAAWQAAGEPVFHAGSFYYPAGATVFFDGRVMVRTGSYEGVPLYSDVTLEPFSIVYVPVSGTLMRPYERKRDGELAGTVGSRTPSFPVGRDGESTAGWRSYDSMYPHVAGVSPAPRQRGNRAAAADTVARLEVPFEAVGTVMIAPRAMRPNAQNYGNGILSTSGSDNGLWISFQDARWFAAGPAVPFDAARFESAGTSNGFPVFRERGSSADRIFVTIVRNGPIAPFERR